MPGVVAFEVGPKGAGEDPRQLAQRRAVQTGSSFVEVADQHCPDRPARDRVAVDEIGGWSWTAQREDPQRPAGWGDTHGGEQVPGIVQPMRRSAVAADAPCVHLQQIVGDEFVDLAAGVQDEPCHGRQRHVYEDWLTQALTTNLHAHGGTVRRQQPLRLDHNGQTVMHTDITWWSGADCLAVIDAKYKRLPPSGPRPEDLYQILAYCTALGIRYGHLVYAAGTPTPVTLVRNANIHIHTHVVPLADTPERILESVAAVATKIAATVDRPASAG